MLHLGLEIHAFSFSFAPRELAGQQTPKRQTPRTPRPEGHTVAPVSARNLRGDLAATLLNHGECRSQNLSAAPPLLIVLHAEVTGKREGC